MAESQQPIKYVKGLQGQLLIKDPTITVADNERTYEGGSGDFYLDMSSQTYKTSIDRIRNSPVALNPNIIYKTKDFDVPGEWYVDEGDTTSADNGVTVLVNTVGQRVKRIVNGLLDVRAVGASSSNTPVENETAIKNFYATDNRFPLFVPANIEVEYSSSFPDNCFVIDANKGQLVWKRIAFLGDGGQPYIANLRGLAENTRASLYIQPNAEVDGVTTTMKMFFDDYVGRGLANYRDFGIFTKRGEGAHGEGVTYLNTKSNGNWFGFYPEIWISHQDGAQVSLKSVRFNSEMPPGFVIKDCWREGVAFSAGDYTIALAGGTGKIYVAASSGITGNQIPDHTTGTESDGGVDWTFFHQIDPSKYYTQIIVGNKNQNAAPIENLCFLSAGDMGLAYSKALKFINADETDSHFKIHRLSTQVRINHGDGIYTRFDQSGLVQLFGSRLLLNGTAKADGSTTADATKSNVIVINDSSPTELINITGGANNQMITLLGVNGQTVLKNTGNIQTGDGKDFQFAAGKNISLIYSATTTKWVETSRSTPYVSEFGESEITGTEIDFSIDGARFKAITADITLTTSNVVAGKPIEVQITNTDVNPHTVTITGAPFPNGADNEIPAGGRAHISLQQINGVMDASIVIYS